MTISLLGYNHIHNVDFVGDYSDAVNGYFGVILKSKTIVRVNGVEVKTPAKSIIIYEQFVPRYYRADGEPFINDWFIFTLDEWDKEFLEALQIPFNTPITLPDINPFSNLIQNISYEKYMNNIYSTDTMNCYLKIFFFKLSEAFFAKEEKYSGKLHDKMNMVYSKIHNLPHIDYSISNLAAEVTVSSHYFQHLYKEMFGISPIKDIVNSRINYARNLLIRSDISIKTISETCGYKNDVHFMRQFKKITGVTPSEYRRQKKS